MREVIILGSTGSIGTQALAVIAANQNKYRVKALAAGGTQLSLLAQQAAQFNAEYVAIANAESYAQFKEIWQAVFADYRIPKVVAGAQAITEIAGIGDANTIVLNGITGSVGLAPTLQALASGATLALANKESLVAGGALVQGAMLRPGQIVPVDSEHSAIAQALRGGRHNRGLTSTNLDGNSELAKIILTASGGPFRGKKPKDLMHVTAAQALKHPTWQMGPVVTINSATLFNKALELIEAAYLFDLHPQNIIPVVHPQSIVHSMVQFCDGSVIAQASAPDMKLPIALGLSWPERLPQVLCSLSWDKAVSWEFSPIDDLTFPAINLARDALAASSLHPAVMNAANEECVAAFLHDKIGYLKIMDIVEKVLENFEQSTALTLEAVQVAEKWARRKANEFIGEVI